MDLKYKKSEIPSLNGHLWGYFGFFRYFQMCFLY